MANGKRSVSTTRLLRQAMDVIFRYHGNHAVRVSGRMCSCTICQDASTLFDDVLAHTRRQVFANPKTLLKEVDTEPEKKKF